MAFNPFNLFKGNPKVLEFMNKNQPLEVLLMEEAFVSQFKRSENEALQNYMNYQKYEQLVDYVTTIDHQNANDKNRSYRFPFVSAQILAVNNEVTFKYLLDEVVFTEEQTEEEVQVEKEVDSDRSYSSIKSNNSSRSSRETKPFQEEDKENFALKGTEDKVLDDFLSEEKEISEDDFPDAPQKKIVLVKEMVVKKRKVPFQPLVFKILRYFQEEEVTHILDGYLSKVLENILMNRFQTFIQIVEKYNRFHQLTHLLAHIDSSSVQELLITFINKMLECEGVTPVPHEASFLTRIEDRCLEDPSSWTSPSLTVEDREYFLNLYYLFVEKLTSKMKDKVTDNVSPNIEKELLLIASIVSSNKIETLTSILGELVYDQEKKVLYSRSILGYLQVIRSILSAFITLRSYRHHEKLQEKEKKNIQEIVQHCEDAFDCIVNLGFSFVFEDFLLAEEEEQAKFKPQNSITSKLQFLEIIGKLTEQNVYFTRKTVIDNPFYEHLLELMNLYPHSSIFHNAILKLVLPFLHPENDVSTLNKFFQKRKFFQFILRTVKADYQNRYQLKKSRCCYIAQITSICTGIEKLEAQQSEELSTFRQSQEWQYIQECLLLEEKGLRGHVLGGLQKQAQRKPIIFFTKKDCLEHFRYFLNGMKFSAFEEFENYEPGNSDSEEEVDPTLKYLIEEKDRIKEEPPDEVPGDEKYFEEDIDI